LPNIQVDQDMLDTRDQNIVIVRFGYKMISPGFQALYYIYGIRERRQGNEWNVAEADAFFYILSKLPSIHFSHDNIADNDGRLAFFQELYGLLSILHR